MVKQIKEKRYKGSEAIMKGSKKLEFDKQQEALKKVLVSMKQAEDYILK